MIELTKEQHEALLQQIAQQEAWIMYLEARLQKAGKELEAHHAQRDRKSDVIPGS